MALTSSGAISLNEMHVELGESSGSLVSINDSDIRGLINKSSGASMSFNEWYGATSGITITAGYYQWNNSDGFTQAAAGYSATTALDWNNHQTFGSMSDTTTPNGDTIVLFMRQIGKSYLFKSTTVVTSSSLLVGVAGNTSSYSNRPFNTTTSPKDSGTETSTIPTAAPNPYPSTGADFPGAYQSNGNLTLYQFDYIFMGYNLHGWANNSVLPITYTP